MKQLSERKPVEHVIADERDPFKVALLQFLVEERRRTVDERTRQSNPLADCLKLYFPQVVQWFDDLTSPLVGDLLERWPGLEHLQRAHPGTLHKFFHEHNCCRGEKRMEERIQAVYQAIPATQDACDLRFVPRGLVRCRPVSRGVAGSEC